MYDDDYGLDERFGFERDLEAFYDAFGCDFESYDEYEYDDEYDDEF